MSENLEYIIEAAKLRREDFHKLVDLYNPLVYRWSRRLTNDEEDIKDIMQEAFIKLYQDLPKLNEPKKFNPWFRKIVINTAYDWFRKHRGKLTLEYIENMLEVHENIKQREDGIAEDEFLGESIKAAIDKLSENNRIVFSLFYEHEKKCVDIAKMLNLTENAVKNRLSRAREHLRNELSYLQDLNYVRKDRAFKILVICCSHKKLGKSFEVAEKVKKSVLHASPTSEVNVLQLADSKLSGCNICYKCAAIGRCDQKDDFHEIYDECLAADVIIFVTPYYAPIPSKLSALLERMMSVCISPMVIGNNQGRAFPLQKKWCSVLNFSIVQKQSYMASVIREPLVALGMGLILTEDKLSFDQSIDDHADLLGKLVIDKLLKTPDSNAIDNWFDYWNDENLKILDRVRKNEIEKEIGVWSSDGNKI